MKLKYAILEFETIENWSKIETKTNILENQIIKTT